MTPGAALFHRHVFLDIETTGLDPRVDEVIEVGALFIEEGAEARRLSFLCAPSRPLGQSIQRLTGLDDALLHGAPPFAERLPEMVEALRGWTVVAHNAPFEKRFLPELFAATGSAVLDSCELLHYLHPEWSSHSLDASLRWAGLPARARHRALKDCEDTWAVLQHTLSQFIEEGRAEDVADLLQTLEPKERSHAGTVDPEAEALVELLQRLNQACTRKPAPFELSVGGFAQAPAQRLRAGGTTAAPEADVPIWPVKDEELRALLGEGGAMEQAGQGFRSRSAQLEMSLAVGQTLSHGGLLAVEAGTGTGKSLAYLAPAALFAARNGLKVGIAPHTKTLQDQLMEKDLPRLHRATKGAFGYALLKGQGNYLCRRRTLEATMVEPGMPHSQRAPRAYVRAFLRRSPDGDLDRLSHWFRERFPALLGLLPGLRSEASSTMGERCAHYHRCYYHSAVEQAKAADVLVVNQSLAFAWPQRYPKLEHLILDEAHELEDVATTAQSSELSDDSLKHLYERMQGRDGRRGVFSELRKALASSRQAEAARVMGDLEHAMTRLHAEGRDLGDLVLELCEPAPDAVEPEEERGYLPELRVTEALRSAPTWQPVREGVQSLKDALATVLKLLTVGVQEVLPELATRQPTLDRELSGAASLVQDLLGLCEELGETAAPGRCYSAWAQPRSRRWTLLAQPVDVSRFISDDFAPQKRALILSSATLSAGRESPFVLQRLGLGKDKKASDLRFMRAPSPFALEKQALVVLVTDAPRAYEDAFVQWASGRLAGLARAMGGRLLGLFASSRRLERVAEQLEEALEPEGIEVLRQSRGQSRSLAARQERDAGTVLLGTKSFWQGVDIPGRGVACVFIDKLPLEPSGRPLVAAREEKLGSARMGFFHYRLPRALLLLRQGVGRLIRSHEDRGIVVIADPGHASYRAQLLEALAGYRVETLPWAQARLRIFAELQEMGLMRTPPERKAAS